MMNKTELVVIKKNGRKEHFDTRKITKAVSLAAQRVGVDTDDDFNNSLLYLVIEKYLNIDECNEVIVDDIHFAVENALSHLDKDIKKQYRDYVGYKKGLNLSFANIAESSKRIVYDGDKENANKNSTINSTKKELMSGLVSKELMLEYELPRDIAKAHKDGDIYIHDLTDRFIGSFNCTLFDVGNVLKGGFSINGVQLEEPDTMEGAIDLLNDIIMSSSSQQYGGWTFANADEVLGYYVEKSYYSMCEEFKGIFTEEQIEERLYKSLRKKIKSLEYKINCVNNSNGRFGRL